MGQCVARDLGFNVDRQTKDAALMKKMQERLSRKRTTNKDRAREDFTYSDLYDRTYQQNRGDANSDPDDPLDFKTSILSKHDKTSRNGSNHDTQYEDRDTLVLSVGQSPLLKDPKQRNKELMLALADSETRAQQGYDSAASATLADRRVAQSRKDFFSAGYTAKKDSTEEEPQDDTVSDRVSDSSKEEGKVGEEDEEKVPERKKNEFSQKKYGYSSHEKRETLDTAAQRLNRFRENKPFEFQKIKKENFIEDKALGGRKKSPYELSRSPNERSKSPLSKVDLFEGIDKIDFRPQIKNYTEKSLVYQSSLSTGPRIIGFENEFFKDQVTKHANVHTPAADEKFKVVFPEGFDTENTDLE